MIHMINCESSAHGARLRTMFEARKQVFVDLLKWEVPVVGGTCELDAFDDSEATYLVLSDGDERHLASTRLLKTTRPHILDSLFSVLVDGPIPTGETTYEITRFCLDRSLRAPERREARNRLVTGLVQHALDRGIERYTGVAEVGWYRQIETFGWNCEALGSPKLVGGATLTAMVIDIDMDTPARLAECGIWSSISTDLPSLGGLAVAGGRA